MSEKCKECKYRETDGTPHEMCKGCVCGNRFECMSEEISREEIAAMLARESEEMTREQAITVIQGMLDNPLFNETNKQAFRVAIAALSAEPCSDAISKEKVIDILDYWYDGDSDGYVQACKSIYDLPSVHAEPRTGYWIETYKNGEYIYTCSSCKQDLMHGVHYSAFKHCPNCGAKMEADHE